jgi:hypothetical protein
MKVAANMHRVLLKRVMSLLKSWKNTYRTVHSIYVTTHPYSNLSELDFKKQAAHFVAEACMVFVAQTCEKSHNHHLAEKMAGYCRMARICSSIQHKAEYPKFMDAEEALKREMDVQYQILLLPNLGNYGCTYSPIAL